MLLPLWITALPWDHIREAAEEHNVPVKLVAAIVQAESSGDSSAVRHEPNYKWHFSPRIFAENFGITVETETQLQSMSWGLMQVMGGTARELGHKGPLTDLTNPDIGLKYGCLYVKKMAQKYSSKDDIIAAYNAGSVVKTKGGMYMNQLYVDKVSRYLRDLDSVIP